MAQHDSVCISKNVLFEAQVGYSFNWQHAAFLLSNNPLKARQARRAFVGERWGDFKKQYTPNQRKNIYEGAVNLV